MFSFPFLLGRERIYYGGSIQSILHLVRTITGVCRRRRGCRAFNLDQSKAFGKVNHWYLATVLQASGFEPDICKWISLLYRFSSALVEVNRNQSSVFALSQSVHQGCPLSPLLYTLALEILRQLRHRACSLDLREIAVFGGRTRVFAYADDVSIFVSCRSNVEVVQKALGRYEKLTGAKINRDKSLDLRLAAW